MSRVILACSRTAVGLQGVAERIDLLNWELSPSNVEPVRAEVRESANLLVAALNPGRAIATDEVALCLGVMFEKSSSWAQPGAEVPDGTFSLYRSDDDTVELITDATGTRTIWYTQTEDLFLASCSQRALVALLGGFQPDQSTFSWFLSSGSLGPGSWDRRIRRVPANSCVSLDRASWRVSVRQHPVRFDPLPGSWEGYENEMVGVLEEVCGSINVESQRWVVPLSGGYDSRAILMFLRDRAQVKAVTWGTTASRSDPEGDAAIAAQVAKELGVPHEFLPVDVDSTVSPEVVLDRYLVAGEGRVDHLSGYLDGFSVWRHLREEGFDGTLRGDIGWPHYGASPTTPLAVRANGSISCLTLADYCNLPSSQDLGLPEQELLPQWDIQEGEGFPEYAERLYQEFRMPLVLAGLNDLKTSFLEIANPFCSRRFVELTRRLPDGIRREKRLFTGIVEKLGPKIPFARNAAVAPLGHLFGSVGYRDLMLDELGSSAATGLLGSAVIALSVEGVTASGKAYARAQHGTTYQSLRRMARRVRRLLSPDASVPQGPSMNMGHFALRAVLISRMCRILKEDGSRLAGAK